MTEIRTHAALIELTGPVPQDVAVGTAFVVKLKVTCTEGCDLRALPVCVSTVDAKLVPSGADTGNTEDGSRDIALNAPRTVGEHAWSVALAADAIAGVVHAAAPLPTA